MRIKLDPSNCESYTDLSYQSVLEISGLYEAVSLYEIHHFSEVTWEDGIIFVSVLESNNIKQLSLRINLKNNLIEGRILNVGKKSKRIGLKLLMGQVKASLKFDIFSIKIYAFGDPEIRREVNGYITLGSYGFLMDAPYQTMFLKKMFELGRPEVYLHELLKFKKGIEIWTLNGFSWEGTFIIFPNSPSMMILKEKLNQLKRL